MKKFTNPSVEFTDRPPLPGWELGGNRPVVIEPCIREHAGMSLTASPGVSLEVKLTV